MAWNNEKIINFIEAVQLRVPLWDNKSSDFKDRLLKKDEWTAIGQQFQMSHEEAAKKFKNLRTYYNNELKKLEKKQKSGSGASQNSNWFAFKSMCFLKGVEEADPGLETETQSEQEMSSDDPIWSSPQLPPPTQSVGAKKKKTQHDDIQYQQACEVMDKIKQKLSKSLAFGEHINEKLLTYSQYVRNQVEYKISTILYEADMGYYDERNTRNSSSSRQYSPMQSASSTSYRQNVYSSAPSPFCCHAIHIASPSPISPNSNYNSNDSNTLSPGQYSPTYTSPISYQDKNATVTQYPETTQFNFAINSVEPQNSN